MHKGPPDKRLVWDLTRTSAEMNMEEEQEPRDTSSWILGFPGRVWAVPALIIMGAIAAGGVPTLVNPSKGWTGYMIPVFLAWWFITGIIEGLDEQYLRQQEADQEEALAGYEDARTQPEPSPTPPDRMRLPEEPQPEAPEATGERQARRTAVQRQLDRRAEVGEFL